ncbi:MAG: HlyD family type I secretion periplasmic adaptor subunit [Burkholderiaceae bacterium]
MIGRFLRALFGFVFYPIWPMPRDIVLWIFDKVIIGDARTKRPLPSDLAADAQWLVAEQDARGSRGLLWTALLVVLFLITWAAYANVDEVVRGEGKVVPSRQVQIVQSLDGGIVEEILVRPGEQVTTGQVLLKLDPTRYSSDLGETRSEWLALQAKAARLQALANGTDFDPPEIVATESPEVITLERRIWETKTQELNIVIDIAEQQLTQRREELRETRAKREQAAASCSLTTRELDVTRPLLKSGAVSEVDLLRLQRDVSRYCGDQQAAEAQISRLGAAIEEAQSKIKEAQLSVRNEARTELADVRSRLAALTQGQLALADRVRLTEVRSPVNGTVKTLIANTVGGVIQSGKDIVEIVPTDDTLLLDVKINPSDIGFLHLGQRADVKFTAYDFAIYGGLQGQVEQIGADTFTDQEGVSYYTVKVRTDTTFVGDNDRPIIAGMVADVHIMTGKRTILQYLLKPILRAKENAFRER